MPAKVFIGCSTESKPTAERLAAYLRNNGFDTLNWFARDDFRGSGNVTLWNNLLRIASEQVQKAVFIFAEDDIVIPAPTTFRHDEAIYDERVERKVIEPDTDFFAAADIRVRPNFKPRDNVLIEYGLFVGKLGPDNVVILKRPGVKMPTDLSDGMSHRTFEEVLKTLRDNIGTTLLRRTYSQLLFGHSLVMELCRHVSQGKQAGRSRYIYSTRMGALAWRAIECETWYQESLQADQLNTSMKAVLSPKRTGAAAWGAALLSPPVLQVISYGPGIGVLDQLFLTSALPNKQIAYIPIDISVPLLSMTIDTMKGAGGLIGIPFAVHGDFEDGIDDVIQMLRAELGKQPRLHLMLGGTFANIEKKEDVFLKTLARELGDDDLFLLDVFSKQSSYREENDPFMKPTQLNAQQKMFLAVGVAKTTGKLMLENPGSEAIDALLHELIVDIDSNSSSVPGTTTIRYRVKDQPGNLFSFRRYTSKKLARYLAEDVGFEVIHKESFPRPLAGLARSVFILRKRRLY